MFFYVFEMRRLKNWSIKLVHFLPLSFSSLHPPWLFAIRPANILYKIPYQFLIYTGLSRSVFKIQLLIHSANPQSQPVVIIVVRPFVRPYVHPHFSNLAKRNNRKQWSLLARVWVWPSGSLDDTCLVYHIFIHKLEDVFANKSTGKYETPFIWNFYIFNESTRSNVGRVGYMPPLELKRTAFSRR